MLAGRDFERAPAVERDAVPRVADERLDVVVDDERVAAPRVLVAREATFRVATRAEVEARVVFAAPRAAVVALLADAERVVPRADVLVVERRAVLVRSAERVDAARAGFAGAPFAFT